MRILIDNKKIMIVGDDEAEISVCDINGKMMGHSIGEYDTSSLPQGIYIIMVNSNKGKTVKKIVI